MNIVLMLMLVATSFAQGTLTDYINDANRFLDSRKSCAKANVLEAKQIKRDIVYAEPTEELSEREQAQFLNRKRAAVKRLVPYLKKCPNYQPPKKEQPVEYISYEEAKTKVDAFITSNPVASKENARAGHNLNAEVEKSWKLTRRRSNDKAAVDRAYDELFAKLAPYEAEWEIIAKEIAERRKATKRFVVKNPAGAIIYRIHADGTYYAAATIAEGSQLKADTRFEHDSPYGKLYGGLFMYDYFRKLGISKEFRGELNRAKIFVKITDLVRKDRVDPTNSKLPVKYVRTEVTSKKATLRVIRLVKDKKHPRGVYAFVYARSLDRGTLLDVDVNNVVAAPRYVSNGGIRTTTWPFLRVRTKAKKGYFISINDIEKNKVIAARFDEQVPSGESRLPVRLKWSHYNPTGSWGYAIAKTLRRPENNHLLHSPPSDITNYCSSYNSLPESKKISFWANLMSQIAKKESAYNPFNASDEGFFDERLDGVISSGVSQISLRSIQANSCYQERGCEGIVEQSDLYHPMKNLSCAMAIWSCQIERGDCVSCKKEGRWQGIASYWSPMQERRLLDCDVNKCRRGYAEIGFRDKLVSEVKKELSYCR